MEIEQLLTGLQLDIKHHTNARKILNLEFYSALKSSPSPSRSMYSRISLKVRTPTNRLSPSITTKRWTLDFRIVSKIVSRRSSMEQVYIPGKSYSYRQIFTIVGERGYTYIGAFLKSLANVKIQLVISTTLDQGNNVHSFENVGHNPYSS